MSDQDKSQTSMQGPMKGVPDEQTPAIKKPGEYTGTTPKPKESEETETSEENS